MFITDEDYKVVIGENALKVVSQVSTENRTNAEMEAQEEIAGYLRPKYDCTAIFSTEGGVRNKLVVMYCCDIALYHMAASLPQKMGMEIRKERYERAIKWLGGAVWKDNPGFAGCLGRRRTAGKRYIHLWLSEKTTL